MRNASIKIKVLDAVALLSATFTAAATDIITANAHGLKNNDAVILTTADTLPAGLSLLTRYYVIGVTTNTFKLSIDRGSGVAVNITDTGTGEHTFTVANAGEPVLVADFRHKQATISCVGFGAADTATIKCQGSNQEDIPDFDAAKTADNEWDYIQMIDLEDSSTVDGDTGVAFADSVDLRKFVINADGLKWITFNITAQSDTANTTITVDLSCFND